MTLAGNQVPLEVYTPSAAGAVDHSHGALFDAASAGSRLTEWVALSPNVAAPVNGQVYRLTQVTLTP